MQLPEHYPPLLADIASVLYLRMSQQLAADQAEALARACTDDLHRAFPGCQMYIPKRDAVNRAERDAAIARDFNGRNHAELARRHRLTVTRIYSVLRRQRQPSLF